MTDAVLEQVRGLLVSSNWASAPASMTECNALIPLFLKRGAKGPNLCRYMVGLQYRNEYFPSV